MSRPMRIWPIVLAFVLAFAAASGCALALGASPASAADAGLTTAAPDRTVAVADIPVEYEDGTPVEDGVVFDLFDMTMLYIDPSPAQYTVADGKLSGIAMQANTQYMLGFNGPSPSEGFLADASNPYWHTLDLMDDGVRAKFVYLYARYDGALPLAYDFDEGVEAPEAPVEKLIVHRIAEGESPEAPASTASVMNVMLSEGGYAAEAGVPVSLTRRDTGKKKTVSSKQGQVCLGVEAGVSYSLTVEQNPTYKLIGDEVRFSIKTDSAGSLQAVIDGYDVDDSRGWLVSAPIELKRIDGKPNPKLSFVPDATGGYSGDAPFAPSEYQLIYETRKVILRGMPVFEVDAAASAREQQADIPAKRITDGSVKLEFYNATLQRVEGIYESRDGVLPDIEMVKGHSYIVASADENYEMPSYYIRLNRTGDRPTCTKCADRIHTEYGFMLAKRSTPVQDAREARRVDYALPVYRMSGNAYEPVAGVKVRLVSPWETVEVQSDASGQIRFSLIEDWNYMVLVDDAAYSIESFPLVIKDKSEYGQAKYPFNHFSCGAQSALFLVDKGTEHAHDTLMVTPSKKTTVTGLHFGSGSYFINDRQLDSSVAAGLVQGDYEVFAIEAINMYRIELSKLAAGDFAIERTVPAGKKATGVYFIDGDGRLVPLAFTQKDGKVSFAMGMLSMYPNVISYEAVPTDPVVDPDPDPAPSGDADDITKATLNKAIAKVKASSVKTVPNIKSKKMTVSWTASKGASKYELSYRSAKAKKWSAIWTNGKTKATVSKLKAGTLYQLRIASYKKAASGWQRSAYTTPTYCYYKTVSGVACKPGKSKVTVTWKNDAGATGYEVLYSKSKGMKNAKTVTLKGKAKVKCTIKNLKKGTRYYVQVRPIKKYAGKTYTGVLSAKKSVKAK